MDFLVKMIIVKGSEVADYTAVNSYQSYKAKDKVYNDMELGAETWIGGYQHNITYSTIWMQSR